MSYIYLANFKYGLDARRSELSAQPGTLMRLQDAHINQGGEVEKRKAFVKTLLPTGTFGAQPTTKGIVVFGSVDMTGVLFPSPYIYQRLQSRSGAAMTSVVSSTSFDDETFVIATFADGQTFAFYNGTLVGDFIAGEVNIFPDNASIAAGLAALVSSSGQYTAIYNYDGAHPNTFDVYSLPTTIDGNPYGVAIKLNSASGTLTDINISAGSPSTAAGIATGSFQIVAGANDVSGVLTTDGTNPADTSTIVIGLITYTFKTTPAAGSSTALDVQIGANAAASLANLSMAINQSGTAATTGTFNYYTGGVINTKATSTAVNGAGTAITVNSIIAGSVAVSQSGTTHLTWSGLSGGATGNLAAATANYVSSIKVGALEILGANIAFAKDLATTITNVVNQIISYSASNPDGGGNYFTAASNGNTITLSTHADTATYNGAVITVISHGMFFCDNCVFSISGTTFTCDYISVNDPTIINTNNGNIMTAVLTFPTNSEQLPYFAQRICANINAYLATSGYKAISVPGTATIYVAKPTTATNDVTTGVQVSLTGTAGGGGGSNNPLAVSLTQTSATYISSGLSTGYVLSNGDGRWVLFTPVVAVATGGTPPYTYTWTIGPTMQIFVDTLVYDLTFPLSSGFVGFIASSFSPSSGGNPPNFLTANSSSSSVAVYGAGNQGGNSLLNPDVIAASATPIPGAAPHSVEYIMTLSVQATDSTGAFGIAGPIPVIIYINDPRYHL